MTKKDKIITEREGLIMSALAQPKPGGYVFKTKRKPEKDRAKVKNDWKVLEKQGKRFKENNLVQSSDEGE